MGKGGYKGKGGQKGKGKRDEQPEWEKPKRDSDLDRRFSAPPSATSHNVNAFLLCLSLYLRNIVVPWEDYLPTVPIVETFGRFLSWVFRHNPQLLHDDLSLTLNELFWFPQFQQHINNGLSYMQDPSYRHEPCFGVIDCQEVRDECKRHNMRFESVQYFVPFVCVTWLNGKGRFSLAVQQEGVARIPAEEDWKTPPMNNALMFEHIRYNGVIRGTNIFFRAQSGHSNIKRTQRPGVEYDFRHNMLMHKTTANKFEDIKASRSLKVMGGRDIHLVPVEFLYHDPDMLRQYGERVILLNLHQEETRKALRTARETPNGYILLNEDVPIERFEAVYALEKTQWEFPFSPTTAPKYNQSHGLDDAQALCSYFSRCYNVKRPVSFEDLDASLKGRVTEIGQHYEQNLRHSGVFGDAPVSASAETPAQKAERRKDKAKMIDAVVQDLTSAVNEEAQKIQPKERPRPKRDPPELPKDVEEGKKKTKPPPECATTKLPPPQFRTEQQTTDTTVKSEPMQHEGPPPPPKRPAPQKPVKQEEKKTRKEETGGDPSSSSTKPPIPIPPPAPERKPQPPDFPPPSHGPKQPNYPPPGMANFPNLPTPPAPPRHEGSRRRIDVLGDFYRRMTGSDTTDTRTPLPRHRPDQPQEEDERERDAFDLEYHDNSDFDAYVAVMNEIEHLVPDSQEAKRKRAVVWDRLAYLAESGVTTGSRLLDRMIAQGRDSIEIAQYTYFSRTVPTPAAHFERQDPGEAGSIIRPHLMMKIEDDEFNWDVLDALRDLGRNCLAGRSVLSDHPRNSSTEEHNVDTFYIALTVLNLGRINRIPHFAGKKRYGREIRDVPALIKEKLVLPHVVLNNPGHIITLCESYDFTEYNELCISYGTIGIQCMSDKPDRSPPLALFLKSPHGMIEVLHHWDLSKNTGSKTDMWLIHGVIFLVTFGPRTHDIHPGTRERQEHRYTGEQIDFYSIVNENRRNMHGVITVETQEDDLDSIETYQEIIDSRDPPVRGYPESYVQRMGLAEYRVLVVHVNSYAYHHSRQRVREDLRALFSKALKCMVDFICGDFNQFANRQFSRETGGSIFGGIVLEVLEDAIRALNQQLWRENWISFNISSSSAPQDVFDSVFANNHNEMDCMLCISLFYNKQKFQVDRPPALTNEFSMSQDYIHSVSERPRQLTVYDLCLRFSDTDWHSPLLVRVNSHALKNKRTRGPDAQYFRNQRYRSRQQAQSNWQDDWNQQGRHYGERDDWYQQSRHYGEREGPYTSQSSSSNWREPRWHGQQWEGWYGGHR